MNLAGIEISYLLRDLAAKNSGYYLSNIYGITRDCLLFKSKDHFLRDQSMKILS